MIKLKMVNSWKREFNNIYRVLGIKERRLYLEFLGYDKNVKAYFETKHPSFKIYYDRSIGNYIVNPGTKEYVPVDGIIKELFNEFYFKGEDK